MMSKLYQGVIFYDLKAAYDSVPRMSIIRILRNMFGENSTAALAA